MKKKENEKESRIFGVCFELGRTVPPSSIVFGEVNGFEQQAIHIYKKYIEAGLHALFQSCFSV